MSKISKATFIKGKKSSIEKIENILKTFRNVDIF